MMFHVMLLLQKIFERIRTIAKWFVCCFRVKKTPLNTRTHVTNSARTFGFEPKRFFSMTQLAKIGRAGPMNLSRAFGPCTDNPTAHIDTKSSAVYKNLQFALIKHYEVLIFQIKMRKPLRRAQPAFCACATSFFTGWVRSKGLRIFI